MRRIGDKTVELDVQPRYCRRLLPSAKFADPGSTDGGYTFHGAPLAPGTGHEGRAGVIGSPSTPALAPPVGTEPDPD